MTEAELKSVVRRLITYYGLYGYHVPDSRRTRAGFPDFVIIGIRGILWRELKSPYGELSGEQRRVGYLLQAAGADWDVWRPLDYTTGRINRELAAVADHRNVA